MELIPDLPEELGLECLSRLPYTAHRVASEVCQIWSKLLKSRDFYHYRKKYGYSQYLACLVQAIPDEKIQAKVAGSPSYGITAFDTVSHTWERLSPVPKYVNGLPLFCQLASCEGKLVIMGGWNPVSYEPVQDVFVYDFMTQEWKQGKDMPSKRSFFAAGAIRSKIYIAGGHDEDKNALKSAWVYDLREDEWTELTQMSQERDECQGLVIGNEFWVVSGYRTETQGIFENSCESYQIETGRWKPIEVSWTSGRCPRSCLGFTNSGELVCLPESDSLIRGLRTIPMAGPGTMVLLSNSTHLVTPQEIFIGEVIGGKIDKLEKLDVPNEFHGFVQSGCFVEI